MSTLRLHEFFCIFYREWQGILYIDTHVYIYMAEYIYSYTNILHRQPLHILKILINSGFGILINVHIYKCTNISFRSFSRFFVTCMIVKVFKGLGMTKIIDLLF